MACFVIIIGTCRSTARAGLASDDANLILHRGEVEQPCAGCVRTSLIAFAGATVKQMAPGTAEMYVLSFGAADESPEVQLQHAIDWIASESVWLDDPDRTVYTIKQA